VKPKSETKHSKSTKQPKDAPPAIMENGKEQSGNGTKRDFGLTVRIEVNLPPAADQETFDRIFRSIRENLLNAK
jgi:hypothetical protein